MDYTIDSDDEWDNEPDDAESLASNDDDDEEEIDPADIERADGLEEVRMVVCWPYLVGILCLWGKAFRRSRSQRLPKMAK